MKQRVYSCFLTNIDYSNPAVEVQYTNTIDGDSCSVYARTVIYTPSVGVLRDMANVISPALNPGIVELPLEMGTVTKIFYQFRLDEEPFWDPTIQWIITGTDEKKGCNIWMNYDYQGQPKKFDKTFPGCRILACWMSQGAVDAFAESDGYQIQLSDTDELLKPLSDAFGVNATTKLQPFVSQHITTWLDDPCTKWILRADFGFDYR